MAQLSLFDFPKFKITKKIRLIELFGGIGSQAMALRDIGADFEHYKLVEFDKYAVASYNAIHDTRHTTHDIRQIHAQNLEIKDKDKYCYLMTYSFPCTDLSVAGKMQGMSKKDWEEGNSTKSGLLWEVERILKECSDEELPDVLLMENVPQVHAEQNKADFDNWLNFLKSKGYWNFWKDLNAKDFGIPQNRDRCFCVSILSKDFVDFEFPEPVKLEKVMKDYLEDSVDEKYYINNEKAKKLIAELIESGVLPTDNRQQTTRQTEAVLLSNQGRQFERKTDVANCLMARDFKGFGNQISNGVIEIENLLEEVKIIGQMDNTLDNTFESANRVYDKNGLCPTISTCAGGDRQPKVVEKTKYCVAMRGRDPDNPISSDGSEYGTVISENGLSSTLAAGTHGYCNNCIQQAYRIRKLTPKECWRLMGYTDKDFEKAAAVNSNTQLYKQAGNAIVKQVLMAIFSQLLN